MREFAVGIRAVKVTRFLQQTIEGLEASLLRPAEIIIAVPEDEEWDPKWEELRLQSTIPVCVIKAPRGMITQRAACIEQAKTRLLLLMDDDIIVSEQFTSVLVDTLKKSSAQCAVPYFAESLPKGRFRKLFDVLFLLAIPQRSGGIKYLPGGGFLYPKQPLQSGEAQQTEGGIGAAILVDREWVVQKGTTGDLLLQQQENPWAAREDGAFIYSQVLAGGKALLVNAGEMQHLGGTTRLHPLRRQWAFEGMARNNLLFWRKYLHRRKAGLQRLVSLLAITWNMVGLTVLAVMSSVRGQSVAPLLGLAKGVFKYRAFMASNRGRTELC